LIPNNLRLPPSNRLAVRPIGAKYSDVSDSLSS
jgi:hypothetical protein